MVKIGIISWKQGGGTNDYILPKPARPWKKDLKVVEKGTYKGKIDKLGSVKAKIN